MIVNKNIFVEKILPGGIVREFSEEEMNVYRAPYTEPSARKPLWRWPNKIPIEGEPSDIAELVGNYNEKLVEWDVPKLLLHAEPGALLQRPAVEWCEVNLKNLTSINLGKRIHFLQEDYPHAIGEAPAEWYQALWSVFGTGRGFCCSSMATKVNLPSVTFNLWPIRSRSAHASTWIAIEDVPMRSMSV